MKPRDLIAKLQQLLDDNKIDPNLDVVLEGCDCFTVSADVKVHGDGYSNPPDNAKAAEISSR